MDEKTILEIIGDPREVDKELRAFSKSARWLSSRWAKLVERYPQEWIAVYSSRIRAHGPTLDSVLKELDAKGVPREKALVRFIQTEPRKLIL